MKGIRIRPEETGLRASLFDFEAEIMELVWGGPMKNFSVHDLHEILQERRDVAYTTVMTTLNRLCEKEILARVKDGRRFLYRPRLSRAEFIRQMTRNVMNSLPPLGQSEAVAMLVERVSSSDEAALDALEALIQKQRERLK